LDRRYESLRTRNALRERRLLGSLAQVGQQVPIIVVRDEPRLVVVDDTSGARSSGWAMTCAGDGVDIGEADAPGARAHSAHG